MPSRLITRPPVRAALLAAPGLLWLGVFLALPLGVILTTSFLSQGEYGQIEGPWTLENYQRFAGFGLLGFDPVCPWIVARSLWAGAVTTGLCMAAGLPLAFCIAGLPRRWKTAALTLLVIPLWTNLLIRTYAWQILLGPGGPCAAVASWLGWGGPGFALYPGPLAVYIALMCDYLPFLALPLYASVEKIDPSLAEAARDLGAGGASVFYHAILPQIRPGLAAGALLTFLPAAGQFVIPDLLGGARTTLVGGLIQQQFGPSRDWPFGSAVAALFMGLTLAWLWMRARSVAAREAESQAAGGRA